MEENKKEVVENQGFVYCKECGGANKPNVKYCEFCGKELVEPEAKKETVVQKQEIIIKKEEDDDVVKCPKCGSKQVEFVTQTKTKGVSGSKACCGWVLLGPLGAICGMSGAGKSSSKTIRKCKKCGYEF